MSDAQHFEFMQEALALAAQAASMGEVPVGAVIVHQGRIIGTGRNGREATQLPTAHAELLAIEAAARHLGSFRLEDTTLYVTLEPCPMCAGAIVNARIPTVVYGCDDQKAGAVRTLYQLLEDPRLNHRCTVIPGVAAEEAATLLRDFFFQLRQKKND
ncbi:MAG: tRNA adenosine(34) deaminase TadA [Myxococcota bacterium]|jgi:tRNA(adenine34) deaminase|nr:tRNA adenosine(34) deaminase TadA [Myxococcota bacterium]